jgi:hypothetical protein
MVEAEYDRTKIPAPKTTGQAVKKKCLDCVGGEKPKVRIRDCPIKDCILFSHRFGVTPARAKKRGHDVGSNLSRLTMKDLRKECVWCMGGGSEANRDVRECKDTDCGLYPFRMGRKTTD